MFGSSSCKLSEFARALAAHTPDLDKKVASGHEVLLERGERADHVLVVTSGDVCIVWDEQITDIVAGPSVVGLEAALLDGAFEISAKAEGQVIYTVLPRAQLEELLAAHPKLAMSAMSALAEVSQLRQSQLERAVVYSDRHMRSPGAEILPGPIIYSTFPIYYFFMRADPRELAALLPQGLEPIRLLGGLYVFTVSFFAGGQASARQEGELRLCYNEVAPSVLCRMGDEIGMYTTEFYVDCSFAVALGRELYGYPKVLGFSRLQGRELEVTRGDALIFRATWERERSYDELGGALFADMLHLGKDVASVLGRLFPLKSTVTTWTHKRLLSTQATRADDFCVDQLVEIPFVGSGYKNFELLHDMRVKMPGRVAALPGECVGGLRFEVDITVGQPHIIKDYLSP